VKRDLPSGTVTFLFTDIEGSTKLLHDLGPKRYARTLEKHRLILRRAFSAHGGVEVDTQGDAFFVAFPTAPGALAAAEAAKEALAEGPIRVRCGIHLAWKLCLTAARLPFSKGGQEYPRAGPLPVRFAGVLLLIGLLSMWLIH
jgi:adenylate/guanylate cyclase family protein